MSIKKLRDSHPSIAQAWGPKLVIAVGWREQRSCVFRLVLRIENLREPRERERNTKEFWEWQTVKWINNKFVRLFVALSHFLLFISLSFSPSLSLSLSFSCIPRVWNVERNLWAYGTESWVAIPKNNKNHLCESVNMYMCVVYIYCMRAKGRHRARNIFSNKDSSQSWQTQPPILLRAKLIRY